jgi:hypothetical protein
MLSSVDKILGFSFVGYRRMLHLLGSARGVVGPSLCSIHDVNEVQEAGMIFSSQVAPSVERSGDARRMLRISLARLRTEELPCPARHPSRLNV